ncbi:MAG: hypothetical protein JWQ46_93 [Phenylobacterium sp.]|jgi:hypothetical protein|nr:hypothetical protein [Phenylobacterium sp.]
MRHVARERQEPVRYAVRWEKLPLVLALAASAALWLGFLIRGA